MEQRLVHRDEVQIDGQTYPVRVFRHQTDRFIAVTRFARRDLMAVDGATLEEALERHRRLLPLAVAGRALRRLAARQFDA